MLTALCNATVFTGNKVLKKHDVLIDDQTIVNICPSKQYAQNIRVVDLQNQYLAPGFIDLQIYGSGGMLFGGSPSVAALRQMETDLLQQGCTGFMATVATNSMEVMLKAIQAAKDYRKNSLGNFLGLHLEGPYLNPQKKGAHPERYIKKASLNEVKELVNLAEGEIKIMTIAPELQDKEVISFLKDNGILLSAGHSNASYREALTFFDDGVSLATHLYNAMPAIHHRNPGLIPAIFKKKPFASIIADGIHVSFPMIEMAKHELGEKLFLITDAVTETTEGLYPHQFNQDHYVMPDGTLSGSSLSIAKAVQNCVRHANIAIDEALRMGSTYPAQAINANKRGEIAINKRADMVVLNQKWEVQESFLKGIITSNRSIS